MEPESKLWLLRELYTFKNMLNQLVCSYMNKINKNKLITYLPTNNNTGWTLAGYHRCTTLRRRAWDWYSFTLHWMSSRLQINTTNKKTQKWLCRYGHSLPWQEIEAYIHPKWNELWMSQPNNLTSPALFTAFNQKLDSSEINWLTVHLTLEPGCLRLSSRLPSAFLTFANAFEFPLVGGFSTKMYKINHKMCKINLKSLQIILRMLL